MKKLAFTLLAMIFATCLSVAQTWQDEIQKNDFAGFLRKGNAVYTVGVDKKSIAPKMIITTYKTTDDFQTLQVLGRVEIDPNTQHGFDDIAFVHKRLELQIASASNRIFLAIGYNGRAKYNSGTYATNVSSFGSEFFVTTDDGKNWESVPLSGGSFSLPFQLAYGSASKATIGPNAVKRYFLVNKQKEGFASLDGKSFERDARVDGALAFVLFEKNQTGGTSPKVTYVRQNGMLYDIANSSSGLHTASSGNKQYIKTDKPGGVAHAFIDERSGSAFTSRYYNSNLIEYNPGMDSKIYLGGSSRAMAMDRPIGHVPMQIVHSTAILNGVYYVAGRNNKEMVIQSVPLYTETSDAKRTFQFDASYSTNYSKEVSDSQWRLRSYPHYLLFAGNSKLIVQTNNNNIYTLNGENLMLINPTIQETKVVRPIKMPIKRPVIKRP